MTDDDHAVRLRALVKESIGNRNSSHMCDYGKLKIVSECKCVGCQRLARLIRYHEAKARWEQHKSECYVCDSTTARCFGPGRKLEAALAAIIKEIEDA